MCLAVKMPCSSQAEDCAHASDAPLAVTSISGQMQRSGKEIKFAEDGMTIVDRYG